MKILPMLKLISLQILAIGAPPAIQACIPLLLKIVGKPEIFVPKFAPS
jgi:hypothetical protein